MFFARSPLRTALQPPVGHTLTVFVHLPDLVAAGIPRDDTLSGAERSLVTRRTISTIRFARSLPLVSRTAEPGLFCPDLILVDPQGGRSQDWGVVYRYAYKLILPVRSDTAFSICSVAFRQC
ncbi:hypothetical protein GE09DRAFT_1151285 [Coniochaeta sp. 2T2.1]|nr:hypothetical protein GE09DRAFT_1151285 [Coniochaeta sp. 2T2.1]